ncbi:ubiquitinyl hydrolase 1 [Malassezia caprae]|uniref:ubiquitinyl hydrolase 1 n=1 Tax=Malassezia caprae TaxID=1381934 RepID=A0AAF0ECL2_9BASI|nr:ubiquitinyl hydrolase 1 [Malassezia caprae]
MTTSPSRDLSLHPPDDERPRASTYLLDRFKRARTTSPDTDASSDAGGSSTLRPPSRESHDDMAPARDPFARRSDESVDSLIGESLRLDDARTPADTLAREVEAWRATPPRLGDTWYVIPAAWYRAWTEHPARAPPAMDLAPLCAPGGQLRPGLLEGTDYELLPKPAFEALAMRYTVRGPTLARHVVPGVAPGQSRIELYPPRIELVLCGAPRPACTALPAADLSAGETLRALKARIRALGVAAAGDDDLRLVRLPPHLRAAALASGGSVSVPVLCASDPPVELVSGSDAATLAALQLDAPTLLLGVDVRVNGAWQFPVGSEPAHRTRSTTQSSRATRGLRGLANLGNTCFMNSALQCLSNTPELREYFLQGAQWDELNAENPLGMGGALAAAYSRLVQALWGSGSGAVVPREFKTALARFAPQFMGYAQQDTQELLAFLLDGLHEDLNRIQQKPYLESPDWLGGTDADMVRFARMQWDMYKARNDSVIVDLFQGQYRSTLVCPECAKVSIKFDPFMYLTLPIPHTRKWRGRVYVVPRARPIVQVDVQLPATATIAQLCERIGSLVQVQPAHLLVGEVWSHHVYRWLAPYEPVRDIGSDDYIYLWEADAPVALPRARKPASRFSFFARAERTVEDIERAYSAPEIPELVTVPVFSCKADGPGRFGSYRRTLGEPIGLPFLVTVPRDRMHDAAYVHEAVQAEYARFSALPADAMHARAAEARASETSDAPGLFALRVAAPSADEAMHRGDDANDATTEALEARIARVAGDDAWPVLYPGSALYALWEGAVADAVLPAVPPSHVWGAMTAQQDPDFVQGTAQLAAGRRRAPSLSLDDCLDEFTKAEQLSEDDLWYCPSCKEFRQATKKFDLWKAPDMLVVHLKRFSAGRVSRDKLDHLIDFPLEGLDLRDRVVGRQLLAALPDEVPAAQTRVSDTVSVVHDPHDDAVEADLPVYDLYAVDNHFGGLGGGHYTAFAKNPLDGRWYNYDDSSVRPVSDPASVKSSAAYVLFYRRRTARALGGKSREMIDRLKAAEHTPAPPPTHSDPLSAPTPSAYSSSDEASM